MPSSWENPLKNLRAKGQRTVKQPSPQHKKLKSLPNSYPTLATPVGEAIPMAWEKGCWPSERHRRSSSLHVESWGWEESAFALVRTSLKADRFTRHETRNPDHTGCYCMRSGSRLGSRALAQSHLLKLTFMYVFCSCLSLECLQKWIPAPLTRL